MQTKAADTSILCGGFKQIFSPQHSSPWQLQGAELSGTDRGLCIVATPRVDQGTDTLVTNPGTLSCSTHNPHAHMEGLLGKSLKGMKGTGRGRGDK